jgi:hypothetical protein
LFDYVGSFVRTKNELLAMSEAVNFFALQVQEYVLVLCSDEITIPGWNTIVLIDGIDDRRMSNFVVRLPARLPDLLSSVFVRVCRWR